MNKLLVMAALAVLFCVPGHAGPCLPGSLQDYLDLSTDGCQLGVVQFTNFFVAPGQSAATAIDPATIDVTPGGRMLSPTLLLTLGQTANAGELLEAFFGFNATAALLSGGAIALHSPSVAGDAAVTGVLDLCLNGTFLGIPVGCDGTPLTVVVAASADDVLLSDSASGPLSGFMDVFVDLTIDGGPSGSASLQSASVTIQAVPEPSAILLTAATLSLIAAVRTRLRKLISPGGKGCDN